MPRLPATPGAGVGSPVAPAPARATTTETSSIRCPASSIHAAPHRRGDHELLQIAQLDHARHAARVDPPPGVAIVADRMAQRAFDRLSERPAGMARARPRDRHAAHLAGPAGTDLAREPVVGQRGPRAREHVGTILGDGHGARLDWHVPAERSSITNNLLPEGAMSNGPKMMLGPRLQITQTLGVYLAPLMTPVLRRARADRPPAAEDDAPWRSPPQHDRSGRY